MAGAPPPDRSQPPSMPTPDITLAYPLMHKTCLGLVMTRVGSFPVCALAALQGQRRRLRSVSHRASGGIDTALRTVGAGLRRLLHGIPLRMPWPGSAPSTLVRALFPLAALSCMGYMSAAALDRRQLIWWAP